MAHNSASHDLDALQSGDFDHVSAADVSRFLHHKAMMTFTVNNLVGSDPTVGAAQTDPNLLNPWGLSESPTSPFWISENGSGLTSIYSATPAGVTTNVIPPITIAVPPGQTPGTASPTGQVFNSFASTGAFTLHDGSPATFLFATEDGTISGWNAGAGTQSIIAVNEADNPAAGDEALGLGAVYKGLAIGNSDNGPVLFAANFRHGTVDTYDKNFNLTNSFTDPNLPKGFAPFNVQVLDGKLFVTFAQQNDTKHDDVAGAGNGFVDEFDLNGHLLQRVASQGPLDSPWGLAIAPQSFGRLAGDLLVGNFGDGTIDAFNLKNDHFAGKLSDANGKPIVIGDLWAIAPGNGASGGSTNTIYFTAGVHNEAQGLFGSVTPNPGVAHSLFG
ncbi:MAG: hypothetical protein JWQ55_5946 [Rhodopila sp.]|jgi:uncharacterized protein (TIGR03118 family)|nr:hypothetical protein [Rhodopila sp.]